jgi:hypothetical protein
MDQNLPNFFFFLYECVNLCQTNKTTTKLSLVKTKETPTRYKYQPPPILSVYLPGQHRPTQEQQPAKQKTNYTRIFESIPQLHGVSVFNLPASIAWSSSKLKALKADKIQRKHQFNFIFLFIFDFLFFTHPISIFFFFFVSRNLIIKSQSIFHLLLLLLFFMHD